MIKNNLYREKLLDKRWLLKRDIILKRDNYRCMICGSQNNCKHSVNHVANFVN